MAVRLQNGGLLTLGRDSSLALSPELLASHSQPAPAPNAAPSDALLSDVERMQRAIAAGADPTKEGEAPAAGGHHGAFNGELGAGTVLYC